MPICSTMSEVLLMLSLPKKPRGFITYCRMLMKFCGVVGHDSMQQDIWALTVWALGLLGTVEDNYRWTDGVSHTRHSVHKLVTILH